MVILSGNYSMMLFQNPNETSDTGSTDKNTLSLFVYRMFRAEPVEEFSMEMRKDEYGEEKIFIG